ncbi:MAG: fibronectin type III domain-containing protein [Paludibacteraceae bacterium]|nr:fibronectin type III domain-containing protein [Paludibacteraceae bacterium]
MKKISLLCALLCASMLSFAIDWSGVEWLGNGVGEGYGEKFKAVVSPELPAPGFINNLQIFEGVPALHVAFPSADFGNISLEASQYSQGGAGLFFHLDIFTAQETSFSVVCSGVKYVLTVFKVDGEGVVDWTEGGTTPPGDDPGAKTAPEAPAPAPTWAANQVKAVYSPTYGANCSHEDWSSGTAFSEDEFGRKYVTNGSGYFGMASFLLNCLKMKKLHADIWIAGNSSMRLVPIYGGAGLSTDDSHGKMVNLTGQQWNSIDLDLATDFAGLNLSSIFQFKIDNAANLTFWVGNLYFYTEDAVTEDTEAPVGLTASLVAADFYSATIAVSATDNSGAVNYIIKDGETEVGKGADVSGAPLNVTVPNLIPGTAYVFNVIASDESGNESAPVSVSVNTPAAPAPAPVPTLEAADVKSLFCDAYAQATSVNNFCEWWWQSPTVAQKTLGEGDNVLYYVTPLDGVFGWAMNEIELSGFQKVHLSVYPLAAAPFEIYPVIQPEGEFHKSSETLVPNQWNEVVLDYTEKTFAPMTQLGFVNKAAMQAFFLDNVFFFRDAQGSGIDKVQGNKVQSTKVIENGVLYIERGGVRYTVTGETVK